jgi:hypothetical protein|tara:strand:+ start:416 stop:763 length:348 start_codon:yes stop_codon:yes gene_type:complete
MISLFFATTRAHAFQIDNFLRHERAKKERKEKKRERSRGTLKKKQLQNDTFCVLKRHENEERLFFYHENNKRLTNDDKRWTDGQRKERICERKKERKKEQHLHGSTYMLFFSLLL